MTLRVASERQLNSEAYRRSSVLGCGATPANYLFFQIQHLQRLQTNVFLIRTCLFPVAYIDSCQGESHRGEVTISQGRGQLKASSRVLWPWLNETKGEGHGRIFPLYIRHCLFLHASLAGPFTRMHDRHARQRREPVMRSSESPGAGRGGARRGEVGRLSAWR